jgi:transposase
MSPFQGGLSIWSPNKEQGGQPGIADAQTFSMARRTAQSLATLWRIPEELWAVIDKILNDLDPPCPTGRSRINQRQALEGVIYRGRTGCQWNHLPREFGDDSSVHRTFQRWERKGVLDEIWRVLVEECDALNGVAWKWQAADGAMGKARHGGDEIGRNPTDRGKKRREAQHHRRCRRRPAGGRRGGSQRA